VRKNSGANALIIDINGALVGHFFNDVQSSGWQVAEYGGLATFRHERRHDPATRSVQESRRRRDDRCHYPSTPGVLKFIAAMKEHTRW